MRNKAYKIFYVILLLSFTACGDKETPEKINEVKDNRIVVSQVQFTQKQMKLGEVKELPFPKAIKVNGMIDVPPENRAVVSAIMGGYIRTTPLLIGDQVKKGQLLVTLENPQFVSMQQEYMEVSGQLAFLKAEFERQQTLVAEKITSQKNFLKSESDYKTALAKYNGLRKQLSMLNISPLEVEKGNLTSTTGIYAPIAGSITMVNVSKGTYISPAMPILEIIDNNHIHLELSAYEKDIMNIKEGQEVDFRIPESSNQVFKGEVHLVGTSISENRTIKVHAHLENEKESNFLTGMFVDANIITETELEISLPEEALVEIDDKMVALLLDEKRGDNYYFKRISIEGGETYNENIAIKNSVNFNSNAQFLIKGAFSLLGE